jgi:hypothetical protein
LRHEFGGRQPEFVNLGAVLVDIEKGIGYGMNACMVLDPSHANFNGGAKGAGTFYWGGVRQSNVTNHTRPR